MDKLTALGFKPSGGSAPASAVPPEFAKLGFKPSGETANVSQETKPIGNEPSYLQRVGQQLSENVLGAPQKAFQESKTGMDEVYAGNPFSGVSKAILGVGGVAAGAIGSLFSPVTESTLGPKQILGAVQGGGEAIGNKIVELSGVTDNPEFQKFAMENPNLGKYLVDAINIAGMFVGGKKGIEEGVKPAGASGEGIISTLAKPIEKGLEKTYDVGTNIATKGTKFGISQATGLNPETLSTAFRDPYGLGEAQKTHYGRMDLAQEVKTKADQAIKDFSDTGKQYDIVRKGNSEVVFPEDIVTKTLNKYGIDIKDGKLVMTAESKPLSPGDVSAIQNFYNQYGNKTNLSGNAFMNAREALSNMSGYDVTTSKALKPLAREMRHAYDTIGKTQLPGLKDLDAIYGPKAQSIKLLKKDLLTKEGELKDSSISKLANIQGKGKEKLQLRMEGLLPGVSQKAARLKAIEDIQGTSGQKVGAYSRSLLTGGLGFAGGGLPGAIATMIATHPSVVTGIIKALGKANIFLKLSAEMISKIEVKLKNAQPLTPKEMTLIEKAIAYENAIKVKAKNIPNKEGGFVRIGKDEPQQPTLQQNTNASSNNPISTSVIPQLKKRSSEVGEYGDEKTITSALKIVPVPKQVAKTASTEGMYYRGGGEGNVIKGKTAPVAEVKAAPDTSLIFQAKKYVDKNTDFVESNLSSKISRASKGRSDIEISNDSSRISNSKYITITQYAKSDIEHMENPILETKIRISDHDLPAMKYGGEGGDSNFYLSTKDSGMSDNLVGIIKGIDKKHGINLEDIFSQDYKKGEPSRIKFQKKVDENIKKLKEEPKKVKTEKEILEQNIKSKKDLISSLEWKQKNSPKGLSDEQKIQLEKTKSQLSSLWEKANKKSVIPKSKNTD